MKAFYEAGTAYVDIAFDEPRLFQYLYMSANGKTFIGDFDAMTDSDDEGNILMAQIAQNLNIDPQKAEIFCRNMMIYTHGLASYVTSGLIIATKQKVHEMMKKIGINLGIILMWIIAIKATVAVLTDSNSAHYNNLPMIVVYILLGAYLLAVFCVTARRCRHYLKF